jgi:hypothetical protein
MHNKEYCRNCDISVPKITVLTTVRARGSVREREQVYQLIPKTGYITKK